MLLTNDDYSFFHSSDWARVLFESYHYKPLYFAVIENGYLSALLPVMEVKSFITGKRGVSLPFTDHCAPIAKDLKQFDETFHKVIKYGKQARWKKIEFRGNKEYFLDAIPSETFLTHNLDLKNTEQEIFSNFKSSTKRNIKKAIKEGVQVSFCTSLESINEFYRLNCMTRKHHGLPPQPYYFFKKVFEHVISPKNGCVILASYQNKIIAGAVYLHLGDKAIYKYGASDKSYLHLRPNNLIMWEAIKWYAKQGYKSFNFGRTEPDHKSLAQFKLGWGTREDTMHYYKYDLIRNIFVKDSTKIKSFHTLFQKLPMPLLRFTGFLLYKHVG